MNCLAACNSSLQVTHWSPPDGFKKKSPVVQKSLEEEEEEDFQLESEEEWNPDEMEAGIKRDQKDTWRDDRLILTEQLREMLFNRNLWGSHWSPFSSGQFQAVPGANFNDRQLQPRGQRLRQRPPDRLIWTWFSLLMLMLKTGRLPCHFFSLEKMEDG